MKRACILGACTLVVVFLGCGDDSSAGSGGAGGAAGIGGAQGTGGGSGGGVTSSSSGSTGGVEDPYGICEKTGESNSTGAGPGDLSCFGLYSCTGGALKIECDGAADGSATCTCYDGGESVLGTCSEPNGIECEYESSCCRAIVTS